jgi:signal transduction histidine kinase
MDNQMKPRRITILRKGLLVLALPLLYQALFIGVLLRRQHDHNEAQRLAVHTKDVLLQTDQVYRLMILSQSNLRGYVLTENEIFAAELAQCHREIRAEVKKLRTLLKDNPEQQERLAKVSEHVDHRLKYENGIVALYKEGNRERAVEEVRNITGRPIMEALKRELTAFLSVEEKLDEERMEALRNSSRLQDWLLVVGLVVNIGIGALAATMFSREISSRIAVVTDNTRRIADGETLPPLVPGSDEIRELDEQFHRLADHLKTARLKERVYQEALERRATDLTRANNDLSQKNQEIEMFVYSVSHDLRSPLVNLQGFSREIELARQELEKLLTSDLSPPDRERARALADRDMSESVKFIQTAVTRLSSIIDALLRLSRAGRVEYQPKLIEVRPIIRRIVEAMRNSITERGAEITIHELPAAWADPTALEQIFANLIGNAVNYLDPKRPGKIEIGTVAREVEGVERPVVFYVKDNGLGIAEAYLPKVFAIFQRLHGNVVTGEGVGLALVRRVVERHGGKVWVESTEGVGSTFFVAFPSEPQLSSLPNVAPGTERIHISSPPHDRSTRDHPPG